MSKSISDKHNKVDELFDSIKRSLGGWQEALHFEVTRQRLMETKLIQELVDGKRDIIYIPVIEPVKMFDEDEATEPKVLEIRIRR